MASAVFCEKSFFRVLPSLTLSVIGMTLQPTDGEPPNQTGCCAELLLLYLREADSDVDTERAHCRRAPIKQSVRWFSFLKKIKHSWNKLNCSTLGHKKQAPASTGVCKFISCARPTERWDWAAREERGHPWLHASAWRPLPFSSVFAEMFVHVFLLRPASAGRPNLKYKLLLSSHCMNPFQESAILGFFSVLIS